VKHDLEQAICMPWLVNLETCTGKITSRMAAMIDCDLLTEQACEHRIVCMSTLSSEHSLVKDLYVAFMCISLFSFYLLLIICDGCVALLSSSY